MQIVGVIALLEALKNGTSSVKYLGLDVRTYYVLYTCTYLYIVYVHIYILYMYMYIFIYCTCTCTYLYIVHVHIYIFMIICNRELL